MNENTTVPQKAPHVFEVSIDGELYRSAHPEPTGRELLALAGKTPEQFLLTLVIEAGPDRIVEPDETVDLSGIGVEEFNLVTKARFYSFRVDEQSFSLDNPTPTGRALLALVQKSPDEFQLTFQIVGEPDIFVGPDEHADLRQPGREQFWTVRRPPLTITIDQTPYVPGQMSLTGEQLRHLTTPPIPAARQLWLDVPGRDDVLVQSDLTVQLRDGMAFYTRAIGELELVIVVNGTPATIMADRQAPLRSAALAALQATGNDTGRPVDQWEVKDRKGNVLSMDALVIDFGFEPGTKLYLSPKIGAGGAGGTGPAGIDPAVSQAKFDREVALYRDSQDDYVARGWWLVKAQFPRVFVVFGTPAIHPPIAAFGATINFTDYDMRPPSVRLVDPFTQQPLVGKEVRIPPLPRRRTNAQNGTPEVEHLLQIEGPEALPFICVPGVREYHDHPAHSGDSWFLHRKRGEGTLYFLLNLLDTYGTGSIKGLSVNLSVGVQGPQRVDEVPE